MIIPVAAERDALGYWTHPSLVRSGCETTAHLTHWLKTHRLACFVMLMCDEDPEAYLAELARGQETPCARDWHVMPPDNDGWFIGSIHASQNGTVCYWLRQIA